MKLPDVETILPAVGTPAVYVPEDNLVVIADLHIGYEGELARMGVFMPRSQITKLLKRIDKLYLNVKAKRILINGDLKHSFSRLTRQEKDEIEMIVNRLTSYYQELIFIKGNHDNYLRGLLRKLGFELLDFYSEKGRLFIHGHKLINEDILKEHEIIAIGHEHPSIALRDSIGYTHKFLACVYAPTTLGNTLVMLPPFSLLSSGTVITTKSRDELLSPISRKYAILEEAVPFIVDEEYGLIELPKLSILEKIVYGM